MDIEIEVLNDRINQQINEMKNLKVQLNDLGVSPEFESVPE